MARKYRIGDGTSDLFDPFDDPFPPFPPEALLHLPPTLPRRPQTRPNLSYRQRYRQLKRSRTFQPSKARLRLTRRHSHCN